ncbi:SRPBCC domain-containing protein [Streptomyces sp. NBC_00201]|uniref:SRPBCC domain-containing protein n=1 Tax=unclassified Streptomyces TaxID=2593676 RepID=UPI002256B01F|nr:MULTISPECIES: SRPBCC domain-containing protein [unclassified Streptomyces]MCX5250912.1 SRPBCC domain-containing protein [Streptomyces sp. NBC_00201]MCX5291159.1 SRPBCC domain-containing protein [Streptomyces sp. NBC_00183]
MIPDTIERTIVINASVERVWTVLTEPGFLGRWFGSGEPVKIDLRPGGLLVFDHGVHGTIPARIETVEPSRLFSWRWSQGAAGEEPDEVNATRVEFTLAEDATGGTRLTMVESGFARLGLPDDEAALRHRANSRNWPGKLDRLRADCERIAP